MRVITRILGLRVSPVSDAITTLGVASREYERETASFRQIAIDSAEADANYKRESAKFKLRAHAEAEGKPPTGAYLDMLAEGDDEIAELYRERMVKAAVLDSATKRLQQLRERVATGRTYVASEREADRVHAEGPHT